MPWLSAYGFFPCLLLTVVEGVLLGAETLIELVPTAQVCWEMGVGNLLNVRAGFWLP